MEGLFPKDAKKISKKLLGGVLAGVLVLGLGSCAAVDLVKRILPGKQDHDAAARQVQAIADKHRFVAQSGGIHAQALISVTYNAATNRCEITWE